METSNFKLKHKWVLWFHKINDNQWNLESYQRVCEVDTYNDLVFLISTLKNITAGMFFLMKDGINPVFEDVNNKDGGYWSLRVNKKDSVDYWNKLIYYICFENITISDEYETKINGLTISPKINNCIFKIWTSDYKFMKTDYIRKDIDILNFDEIFYQEHKAD